MSVPSSRRGRGASRHQPPCEGCGARCCRYMATEIDAPESRRDLDDIRWYLLHRDVSVFRDDEGRWYLAFETPCEELDESGRCRIYADRPQLCRDHGRTPGSCEASGPLYREQFRSVAEFEAWLEAEGLDWRPRRRRRAPGGPPSAG